MPKKNLENIRLENQEIENKKVEKVSHFYNDFEDFINFGFIGVYKRINRGGEKNQIEDLIYPCALGAALNHKYGLFDKNGQCILPQNEYEIFEMFQEPLELIVEPLRESLGDAYVEDIKENMECSYPFIEEIGNGIYAITEDGNEILSYSKLISQSKDAKDFIDEYRGARIFDEMCKSANYVEVREFLENPNNVIIPTKIVNALYEEQKEFKNQYKNVFDLCYEKIDKTELYICANCGLVLKQDINGEFHCISSRCNEELAKRELKKFNEPVFVLNSIAARNIFYPGRLERAIKKVLDEAKNLGIVKEYEMWPGYKDGCYDTWDFLVYLNDSLSFGADKLVIDAKDVKNPKWIVEDFRRQKEGAKFIYVVPDSGDKKDYVKFVNKGCGNEATCYKLKDFKKELMGDSLDK